MIKRRNKNSKAHTEVGIILDLSYNSLFIFNIEKMNKELFETSKMIPTSVWALIFLLRLFKNTFYNVRCGQPFSIPGQKPNSEKYLRPTCH